MRIVRILSQYAIFGFVLGVLNTAYAETRAIVGMSGDTKAGNASLSSSASETQWIRLPDGGQYLGSMKNGQFHGQGVFRFADGGQYVGEFENCVISGKGAMLLPDGSQYMGEFKQEKPSGRGVFRFPDGSTYVGQVWQGQLKGQGSLIYPDGTYYVGTFKDGKFSGQGKLMYPNGRTYSGQFRENQMEGLGTLTETDGSRSIGLFRENRLVRLDKKVPCREAEMDKRAPVEGVRPLTDFRQQITSPKTIKTMKVGEKVVLPVTVKNTGAEIWPSKGRDEKSTWKVGLCYRWFDQAGKPLKEMGISFLTNDLPPGQTFTTDATIESPDKTGEWTLHITMFQDGVAWFDGKGGVPLVMSVKVGAK